MQTFFDWLVGAINMNTIDINARYFSADLTIVNISVVSFLEHSFPRLKGKQQLTILKDEEGEAVISYSI